MYKVKRTIYVDNQSIDVWFGLVSKTKNGNSRPKSNRIYQRAVS